MLNKGIAEVVEIIFDTLNYELDKLSLKEKMKK